MSRLKGLVPEELDDAQRTLFDAIAQGPRSRGPKGGRLTDASGAFIGPFNALLYSPTIGKAVHEFGEAIRFSSSLKPNLLEVAVLVIGREWSSQFEWWAHERFARRDGVSPDVIDAIRERRDPPFEDDEEALVHRFCRELIDQRRVSAPTYREAVALLGEAGVFELVALLGYYSTISMVLNVFEVPVPEGASPAFPEPPIP